MSRVLVVLFVACFFFCDAMANPASRPTSTATPNKDVNKASTRPSSRASQRYLFMWKVQGRHTTHTLLGSIHMVPKSFFPLDPKIEQAYHDAAALVVEADIHNVNFVSTTWSVLKYGTYCGFNPFCTDNLRNDLSPALQKRLERVLPRYGLTLDAVARFKPWFVSVMIQAQALQKAGISKEGIDAYFLKRATAKQQPIKQLESVASQLSIFNQLPPRLQIQLLKDSLEEQKFHQSFQQILRIWKEGDAEKLDKALREETQRNPDARMTYQLLLDKRNVGMTKIILGYLRNEKQPHFIVVGAAHYIGKNSIIDFLQRAGYHPKQILATSKKPASSRPKPSKAP
ncbi:MAG: TraB/GumN family protein [Myxococcales bacterium]|nr:TraB/GumN family protein [Myxococcales bacterium]